MAQSISKNQLQVTTTSQQRWHNVISSALYEKLRVNGYSEEFETLPDQSIGNVDESCILSSEGHLYVVEYGKA